MLTNLHIRLMIIFVSLVLLALTVKSWQDARVVLFMVVIFVSGEMIRARFR